jgi:hypothetical protein
VTQDASDFSAVPSALGYLYQVRYALLLLIDADADAEITLEKLDDVGFERQGTPEELLQFKLHINKTATLTNSCSDLWKTLRVWSTNVAAGSVQPELCRLVLVTTATAPPNSAASMLRSGSARNVAEALRLLMVVTAESTSQDNKAGYESFLALTDAQRRALLNSTFVVDRAPNVEEVGQLLDQRLRVAASTEHLKAFAERLEGWWCRRVIASWRDDKNPEVIHRRLLDAQLEDLRNQFRRDSLPADFLDAKAVEEGKLPDKNSLFIEQLRRIRLGAPRVQDARIDFYRAFQQRSRWIREELIWQGELEQYDDRLLEQWKHLFYAMVEDGEGLDDAEKSKRGRALYTALLDVERHIPIRTEFQHPYVMRGSYHMLANAPHLCWHPDLQERLIRVLQASNIIPAPTPTA